MNLQSYITAIEQTNDVDTLKALWWTIGMEAHLDAEDIFCLSIRIYGRYNKIK